MESMQMIKGRIQSIGSTRQITQSMRLVSTAKVQRARNKMEGNRPFFEGVQELTRETARQLRDSRHPYVRGRGEVKAAAVIVICSDRGLCGGYNINVCRQAVELAESLPAARLITVGTKARDFCRRRYRKPEKSFTGVSETPFFDDAREIGGVALEWFDKGEVDEIHLVYSRFHSLLVQSPAALRLLPFPTPEEKERRGSRSLVHMEPGEEELLLQLAPFALYTLLYGAMLESAACEQSARITSMDAAVKSADEMIDSLSLRYNQARQGAITQEITEIVSGADALLQKNQ